MASSTLNRKRKLGFICVAVPSITVGEAIALFFVVNMVSSQVRLKELCDRMTPDDPIPDMEFAALQPHIRTSEAYWRIRAQNSMEQGKNEIAITCTDNAMQYTAMPGLLLLKHQACCHCRKEKNGIEGVILAHDIQPTLLLPKLVLMRYYDKRRDIRKAMTYAQDIIRTGMKHSTEHSRYITHEAKQYINSHSGNKHEPYSKDILFNLINNTDRK